MSRLSRPRFLTTFSFSLIGLAVAVALWGYGYKLSLYHRHPGKGSVNQVAKLWIKDRGGVASSTRAGSRHDRIQDWSAESPRPHREVANNVPAAKENFVARPSPSPIEFDLLSRPPPITTSL